MVKGFIFFRTGKIPFVIENYRMDLFTDDSLLEIFCKEYNFKENYKLAENTLKEMADLIEYGTPVTETMF